MPTPLGSATATVTVTEPPILGRACVSVTSAVITLFAAAPSISSETAAEPSLRARRTETASLSIIVTVPVSAPESTVAAVVSDDTIVTVKVSSFSASVSSRIGIVMYTLRSFSGTVKGVALCAV